MHKHIDTISYHALAIGHVLLKQEQLLVIGQRFISQISSIGHLNLLFSERPTLDAEAVASRVAHNAIERTASVHALIRDSDATMVLDGWHCEMKADSGN
jgi:hypothetical protein